MDRAKILAFIDTDRGRGIEIGAQTRPVVTREMARIEYVDRASTEELRRWYANDPLIDPTRLVEVDHVWGENDRTLLDCVGGMRAYDYVIASHVLEHVPDLLGWLQEIAAVLVDGGIASFVVPDKRYTFDVLRRTSSRAELVDAHIHALRLPAPRQIFDHFHYNRDLSSEPIRSGRARPEDLPPMHTPKELLDICRGAREHALYIDAHCWVFTPRTFADALEFASSLGGFPWEIAVLHPTCENSDEFHVSLRRLPDSMLPEAQRAAFLASWDRLDLPAEDVDLPELRMRLAAVERALQERSDLQRRAEEAEREARQQALAAQDLAKQHAAAADEARRRTEAAERESRRLLHLADTGARELQAIRDSTSWRITSPLRRAVTAWRQLTSRSA